MKVWCIFMTLKELRNLVYSRLQEGKTLVEHKRIDEMYPTEFAKAAGKNLSSISDRLVRAGLDIQNVPSEDIYGVSGRDPRLKTGVSFFIVNPKWNEVVVTLDGKVIFDNTMDRVGSQSWRYLMSRSVSAYHMDINPEDTKAMRDLQADRRDAKKGSVDRKSQEEIDRMRQSRQRMYDKSGYLLNPDKYKDMLAALRISRGESVLEEAKDVYVQLANMLDKITSLEYYRGQEEYDSIMRGILRYYRDMDSAYKEYMKNPNDEQDYGWRRTKLTSIIKDLSEYIARGKKWISEHQ